MEGKTVSARIELFGVRGDEATVAARKAIVAAGLSVVTNVYPPGAADWAEFPYIREPSGSLHYGRAGIDAFISVAGHHGPTPLC